MGTTDEICALVLEACDLAERHGSRGGVDEGVARDAELLRAELCTAMGTCQDDAVAGDVLGAVAELDALLARVAIGRDREVALSA